MTIDTRWLSVGALVGLVPVALFLLIRDEPVVALSLVSVVLIAASLYAMFGPARGEAAVAESASGG